MSQIVDYINTYMDFPEPGITFKDVMPILWHPDAMQMCIDNLAQSSKKIRIRLYRRF